MAARTSEEESIAPLREHKPKSASKVKVGHISRLRRKCKFRCIGSRTVLLIILWEFLISCTQGIILVYGTKYDDGADVFGLVLLSVSFPVASLLAEVVISRYKLAKFCLVMTWLLSIVECTLKLSQGSLPGIAYTISLVLATALQGFLMGAYFTSAVPLGVDQISSGTNANISAFIQWLWWTWYAGIVIPRIVGSSILNCFDWPFSNVTMIMSLVPVLLLSVGLILDFFFSHKLVREPVTVNPVTLIFKVFKYAAKHKYPVQRSAFTYCENELPSRLDYGKSKFGGPFTTEQVEDVKTFWRVLLVISVASMFILPTTIAQLSVTSLSLSDLSCVETIVQTTTEPHCFIIYCIPLYELLIYPCLRNRGLTILRSIRIGAAAFIISSLYGLTVETIQYFTTNGTTQCLFMLNTQCSLIYIPYKLMVGFTVAVLSKSSTEFICAQAPYNMKSLLMAFYFTVYFWLALPSIFFLTLLINSHSIWFYLTSLLLAVGMSVLLGCVTRWYKGRERDEIASSQAMVEDVYYKYQQQQDEEDSHSESI